MTFVWENHEILPIVNKGIFTYIYHLNWLAGILPSTVMSIQGSLNYLFRGDQHMQIYAILFFSGIPHKTKGIVWVGNIMMPVLKTYSNLWDDDANPKKLEGKPTS